MLWSGQRQRMLESRKVEIPAWLLTETKDVPATTWVWELPLSLVGARRFVFKDPDREGLMSCLSLA